MRAAAVVAAGVWMALACAGSGPPADAGDHYLRRVAFPARLNEQVLLRWPRDRMPLRVHLPLPPEGWYEDPTAVLDSARDGILDWTDVAEPGVPSFEFVDEPGEADIPIFWEPRSTAAWSLAHCSWDVWSVATKSQLSVSRILLTTRDAEGHEVDLALVYRALLHEMGHALGLAGHSDDRGDVMYPELQQELASAGLSARDRATLRALYARPVGSPIRGRGR